MSQLPTARGTSAVADQTSPVLTDRVSRPSPFMPKSLICLGEGYSREKLRHDIIAGVTVGIISLPLAMAFAISSGPGDSIRPEQGIYTAIIAGLLIALLGGSRVSVAGPTGAFIPILFVIVANHGYSGLCIATIMAGIILIIMGLARLGTLIKFIPYPVTTGFTSGIALVIFSQQIKDFLGLDIPALPAGFVEKWQSYIQSIATINWPTAAVAVGSLGLMILIRRLVPRVPSAIVAIVASAAAVALLHLDTQWGVATIGSRFGQIPRCPPLPTLAWWPEGGFMDLLIMARTLLPSAMTIAILGSIESLLCCVVADGMTGGRHKSDTELVAQGLGNIAGIFFGGIPATGAIARTAANIKAGGSTPLASAVHALFLLAVVLLLGPMAAMIPLAALAAVLMLVAWNMSEIDHFTHLLRAPRSDIAVLLATFALTVLTDLTVAVAAGLVLASILFMKRMSAVTRVTALHRNLVELVEPSGAEETADPDAIALRQVPDGVEVFEINGPFFFGVADLLKDVLRGLQRPPRVFILRLRHVPSIDATGMHALEEFYDKCRRQHTQLLLSGVRADIIFALTRYGMINRIGAENLFGSIDAALTRARSLLPGDG